MILEKIIKILSEQFEVEPESINATTLLVEDLGADSLDVVDLMMSIEDYKDVAERYEFLKTQHDDLVEAEKTLVGIIEELDNSKEVELREVEIHRSYQGLRGNYDQKDNACEPKVLERELISCETVAGKRTGCNLCDSDQNADIKRGPH